VKIAVLLGIVMIQVIIYWLYLKHYITGDVLTHLDSSSHAVKALVLGAKTKWNKHGIHEEEGQLQNPSAAALNAVGNPEVHEHVYCYHLLGLYDDKQFAQVKCLLSHLKRKSNLIINEISESKNVNQLKNVLQSKLSNKYDESIEEISLNFPIILERKDCSLNSDKDSKFVNLGTFSQFKKILFERHADLFPKDRKEAEAICPP